MKLMHVLPTYFPAVRYGGPIFSVQGLCRGLVELGHEVHVYTTNIDGDYVSDVSLSEPEILDGVQVHYFSSSFVRRVRFSSALSKALNECVQEFDLIHLHTVYNWPTYVAARAALKNRVPYVLSPRGMLIKEVISQKSSAVKHAWLRLMENKTINNASAVHFTSDFEELEFSKLGYSARRSICLPNGVNDVVQYAEASVSEEVKDIVELGEYVLFLGRINWKKGIHWLIEAASEIETRLLIVGPDEEGCLAELKQLVAKLNMGHRVTFISRFVEGADKEFLFSHAGVFALTSMSENFGNTILEAMLRGVPVLTTHEVGAANIVQDSGCGLVVPYNLYEIRKGLRKLLSDSVLREKMAESGKVSALDYQWQGVAQHMQESYEQILMDKKTCSPKSHL